MTLSRIQITKKIQHISGSAISGATATIYSLPEYGTATVYSAESGTSVIAQPLLTNSDGNLNGWLELGDYSIIVESSLGSATSRFYANTPQQSFLQTYGTADVPLTVKTNASQVGNIVEFQNSTGSVVSSISPTGEIVSPTITILQGTAVSLQGTVNSVSSLPGSVQTYLSNVLGTANAAFGSVSSLSGSETVLGARLGTIEANSWVTTSRIADGAVSLNKFAAAVGTPEISLLAGTTFTSSQSYVLPGSAKFIVIEVTGAGGGGAGGGNVYYDGVSYFTTLGYGGGGGAGGQRTRQICTRAELSGTVTVTVGSGGSGGAAGGIGATQGGIGNAGGWSQFGPIYVPGARPGSGATGANQREFGLTFGSGGFGGDGGYSNNGTPGSGYRNFRGAAGGGGGAGINHGFNDTTGATGGKGFDVPSGAWPTATTASTTVATAGATGAAGDGGTGGDMSVGGSGVAPGGGGGGGGAGRYDTTGASAGGAGARGQVQVWVFG